ncbi:hypothetical protein PNOK_0938800 [Pyrrhoderma noxium]|uniref:Uncharacterized protein n=1 Tax=Pyrrhoderma noxium TaxID=2282107 RepID=A0A286U5I8_9AGAM|nr:hypothetical protein PNOK_0938800 [Pyrrhoderma noxium]
MGNISISHPLTSHSDTPYNSNMEKEPFYHLTDLVVAIISIRVTKEMICETGLPPQLIPLMGCDAYHASSNLHQTIPAWSTVIFFDTVLFSITLIKTWKAWKLAPCSQLFSVLLRDGFIFYAVMLILNVVNLALYTLPPLRGALASALSPVIRTSFSITGSRLILNLRDASRSQFFNSSDETKIESSMRFVGSDRVGEP